MTRLSILASTAYLAVVVILASATPHKAAMAEQTIASEVERVNAASQAFIAAISTRDILAMDEVWAHNANATFIGPLSTHVVVGWDSVRKAWQMRFGQFDRVTIAMTEAHVRVRNGVAWVVGLENVQLLRKDGKTLKFDAFVTNVFENKGGRWLMVSHQATPIFQEAK